MQTRDGSGHTADTGVTRPSDRGWLSAEAEAAAYEGIRRGDEAAFRAVAQPLQPVLRRLAGLSVSAPDQVDRILARTWAGQLRALDRFQWHTPFATWIAKSTVAHARAVAAPAPHPPGSSPRTPSITVPGPSDWSDLPWSARWEDAPETLATAHAALPLPLREVVFTSDVERWPLRRACDVLGLPEPAYARLLDEGRACLRDALAALVGEPARTGPHWRAQIEQTARAAGLLAWPPNHRDHGRLAPATVKVFRRWRAARVPAWRRVAICRPRILRAG